MSHCTFRNNSAIENKYGFGSALTVSRLYSTSRTKRVRLDFCTVEDCHSGSAAVDLISIEDVEVYNSVFMNSSADGVG